MTDPEGDADRIEGRYANYLEIGFNAAEFVLDFGQLFRDAGLPSVHTRIVTNPAHMQSFHELVQGCLRSYRAQYGPIPALDDGD